MSLRSGWTRRAAGALAIGSLLSILVLTLTPTAPAGTSILPNPWEWCFLCGDLGAVDALLNVVLLIPLGLGVGLLGWSKSRAQFGIFALSLGIELSQRWIPGRDPSLGDVVSNTLGGIIGLWLARRWTTLLLPTPDAAHKRVWTLTALLTAGWILVGWLLSPDPPPGRWWWGQVAHRFPHTAHFEGTVLTTSFLGQALPDARLTNTDALCAAFVQRAIELSSVVRSGPPTLSPAPIVQVSDDQGNLVAALEQDGTALRFWVRLRSARIGLNTPGLLLLNASVKSNGPEPDSISGTLDRGIISIRSVTRGNARDRRLALSPSLGWSLLVPERFALMDPVWPFNLLWIASALSLLGYWIGFSKARSPLGRVAPAASATLGMFALAPALTGLPLAGVTDWLGAIVGLLAGLAAAAWVQRVHGRL